MAENIVHYWQQQDLNFFFLRRFGLGQTSNWQLKLTAGKPIRFEIMSNHKNDNFLDCDWFKKLIFSTNSLAKLFLCFLAKLYILDQS